MSPPAGASRAPLSLLGGSRPPPSRPRGERSGHGAGREVVAGVGRGRCAQDIPYKLADKRPGDSAEVWAITDKAASADGLGWK